MIHPSVRRSGLSSRACPRTLPFGWPDTRQTTKRFSSCTIFLPFLPHFLPIRAQLVWRVRTVFANKHKSSLPGQSTTPTKWSRFAAAHPHAVVQPLKLLKASKLHYLVGARERLDGSQHDGRAARCHLLERAHLGPLHRPLLHPHPKVARDLPQRHVGHRLQDGFRGRRDVVPVLRDRDEVGGGELLHVLVLDRVEVQRNRVAGLLRLRRR